MTQADDEPLYVYMGDVAEPHGWYVANMVVQYRHTEKKKDCLRIKNNFDN